MKNTTSSSLKPASKIPSAFASPPELRDFSFASEFGGAKFNDKRLVKQVSGIADAAWRCPESSIPTMLGSPSRAEGLYRLVANKKVQADSIIQPHVNNTIARCANVGCIIVASDSTVNGYGSDSKRKGMGETAAGGLGFTLHGSIAIAENTGKLLGLLRQTTWVRSKPADEQVDGGTDPTAVGDVLQSKGKTKSKAKRVRVAQDDPTNESGRWLEHAVACGKALGDLERVHVADRESDDYKYFAGLCAAGESFVTRVSTDRVLAEGKRLFTEMQGMVVQLCRKVHIEPHKPSPSAKARKTNPPREQRDAKLQVSAGTITIPRSSRAPLTTPQTLTLNYVLVEEIDVADGNSPVIWRLVTTLPVETPEQIARIVDIYRMRWVIEEYWKALKTGCSFGEHQLESYDALVKLLAILLVVAWKMLEIRTIARTEPDSPAELVLTAQQVKCLQVLHNIRHPKTPLPDKPTVKEALWAIAGLGGHFKQNGEPGWQTIGRGLRRLLQAEEDALALMAILQPSAQRRRPN